MPKPQSKSFSASQPVRKAPAGGKTVPSHELVRTTLILRRREGGGAQEQDVATVCLFRARNQLAVSESSTRWATLRSRVVHVGGTLTRMQTGKSRWTSKSREPSRRKQPSSF